MGSFNKKNKSPGHKKNGHWVICDRTGMAIRNQDAKEEWTGSVVAKEEWEPRHPQDYLRAREDDQSPKGLVRTEAATEDGITYIDDANTTLTVGTSDTIQIYNTDLTTNRTVTLSTVGATQGARFNVYRTGGGDYSLDVGGLQTIPQGVTGRATVEYVGTAWQLVSYGTS